MVVIPLFQRVQWDECKQKWVDFEFENREQRDHIRTGESLIEGGRTKKRGRGGRKEKLERTKEKHGDSISV